MTKISIIGCGFVGLCLAAIIANKKVNTIAVDIDIQKIKLIRRGIPPFFEPNLKEILQKCIKTKYLEITSDIDYAVNNSDITFLTVGTPQNSDGSSNLSFIESAIKLIANALKSKNKFHVIVVKSTVVPKTTNDFIRPILEKESEKKCGEDFGLVMNPEFLKEGTAIKDTENPHLIVIGCNENKSYDLLECFYKEIYGKEISEVLKTNIETAELIKYTNNAFLATKISFINTIANICQNIPGTDVNVIAKAIGKDPRIGSLFLKAGPGYGGSCFPKDVNALINFSKKIGYEPLLIEATKIVNDLQIDKIFELIKKSLNNLTNLQIAILGLSFKKDTDDIRESVSIKLIKKLLENKVKVIAHDPMAIKNSKKIFNDEVVFKDQILDCVEDADCCIIMSDWDEYSLLDSSLCKNMKNKLVIDARRILNKEKFDGEIKFIAIGSN